METLSRSEHDAIEAVLVSSGVPYRDEAIGGTKHYEGVGLATLEEILPYVPTSMRENSRQNHSPTLRGFWELGQEFPGMHFHGYLVEPRRGDCRFAIEGFKIRAKDVDDIDRLVGRVHKYAHRMPDEFHIVTVDGGSVWDRDIRTAEGEEIIRAWWD